VPSLAIELTAFSYPSSLPRLGSILKQYLSFFNPKVEESLAK
jgi:hypothetical protein